MRHAPWVFSRYSVVAVFASLAAVLLVVPVQAAQVITTWSGGTGDWRETGTANPHFTPYANPSNGGGTTYDVYIDGGNAVASVVSTLYSFPTIDRLTIGANDTLQVGSYYTFTIVNSGPGTGSINNAGLLNVGLGQLTASGGPVNITGGGAVLLGGNYVNGSATAYFTNSDNVVQGYAIFNDSLRANQGTIHANASGQTLDLRGASILVNTGTLKASGNGMLGISVPLDNSGGQVTADNGKVRFNASGGSFIGGTVSAINGGVIDLSNGTLKSDIVQIDGASRLEISYAGTLDTNIQIAPGGELRATGQGSFKSTGVYHNAGSINFAGTSAQFLYGNVVLQDLAGAAGTVSLSNTTFMENGPTPGSLTNVNNAIVGSGWFQSGFDNQVAGTVTASGGTLTLGRDSSHDFVTNSGMLHVLSGATLSVDGKLVNLSGGTLTGGTYDNRGTLRIRGGTAGITTIGPATTLILDGAGSQVLNTDTSGGNALVNLAANNGLLQFRGGRSFAAAGTFANSGTLDVGIGSTFTATSITGNGALAGSGTVSAATIVAGILKPGNSAGVLTVNGHLSLPDNWVYDWEIGSTGHDLVQLLLGSHLSLDAHTTLNVSLCGLTPPAPGTYELFTAASGADLGALGDWTVNLPAGWTSDGVAIVDNSIVLQNLVPVPEPGTLALLGVAVGVAGFWRSCRRPAGRR